MGKAFILLLMLASASLAAQTNYAGLTGAAGNSAGTISILGGHDWFLGQKQKFILGGGVRFTGFFGSDKNFITAPARLTSGSTGPFVIFKENIEENLDTLLLGSSDVSSLNLFINLGYKISDKVMVGFNIDAIGFSFGKKQAGKFIHDKQETATEASVTSFNVLLVSDNDRGSLNSEFYGRYSLNADWSIKAAAQFIFTEYTTDTKVQQVPEPNDRFRLKSLLFAVGVSRTF